FVREPARMKLLIVVDKLLTGFDAPSCRVLYIDKSMQDHGLFQAICRTNRLDGEDKKYGRIVDYKDLFKKVQNAIAVYSDADLDHTAAGADPNVVLQDRLKKAKERLDLALEQEHLLAESVPPPKDQPAILHHFVGASDQPDGEKEPLRVAYYKTVSELMRAYAAIANELSQAGYSTKDIEALIQQRDRALEWRQRIRLAAGENLDLKDYEADMRFLIDAYIVAEESRKISAFDDLPLLELIDRLGIQEAIENSLGKGANNKEAVAETIENNVGRTIKNVKANDPAFYDRMSQVLEEIIRQRKKNAITYEQYLQRVAELARRLTQKTDETTPKELNTDGKRALFSNLNADVERALRVDAIVRQARPDGWRGVQAKENLIKSALFQELQDLDEVERIFAVVFAQTEY
ncbi:MAG: UvrB domain 3-containing protein, partial [Cyanobacteriota bacterium]